MYRGQVHHASYRARVLGAVTIGQSPRPELVDELAAFFPDGTVIVQSGALDGGADQGIAALEPRGPDTALTTVLRDGRSVRVDRDLLEPFVEHAIADVEAQGACATLLMCTDSFGRLTHRAPLLHSGALLSNGIAGLVSAADRVGVIVPLAEQQADAARNWGRVLGAEPRTAAADPYCSESELEVEAAALALADRGANLLILDCMGYTESSRRAAAAAQIPVLLSRAIVGRLTAELLAALPGRGAGVDAHPSAGSSVDRVAP